jgi:ABC-type transporter Mla subunit MlaD
MRRALLVLAVSASLAGGLAVADSAKNTQDLDKVHSQIEQLISDLGRAEEAHNHALGGHAQKASDLLNQAAKEVHAAIEMVSGAGSKPAK